MADQRDIENVLNSHHPNGFPVLLPGPESHAGSDLLRELRSPHVRLVQAIGRNDAPIRLRGIVDDGKNGGKIGLRAGSNHGHCWCTAA
jgi:hypothetical protein